MKFFNRVLVGIPITCLGLTPFTGGVEEAAQLLLLSIVCTGGTMLAVWIPLWWLVGSLTLALIRNFRHQTDAMEKADDHSPRLNKDETALAEYMKQAAALGLSDGEIMTNVRRKGWSEEQIQKARGILDP